MTSDVSEESNLFSNYESAISAYVQENPESTNTKLFSILALLNAYLPESYLLMEECQTILGPPDLIHGGPPFQERMNIFTNLIEISNPTAGDVHFIHPQDARKSVKLLADLDISRSATVRRCMALLCPAQAQPYVIDLIRNLLTKREMGERRKEQFSLLIKDIIEHEEHRKAVQILEDASTKFRDKHIFPQTVSRLYYTRNKNPNYEKAEEWAIKTIDRAQNNSYAADTLGQVHKNRLLRNAKQPKDVKEMGEKAFEAFEEEEEKAEKEVDPEYTDFDGTANFSDSFNNRGIFGFIQVAKIVSDKLKHTPDFRPFKEKLNMKVQDKFEFFEWYLSYSKPDMTTWEPNYFWKDVAACYYSYTDSKAEDSTSFPGLLDCLNHGLCTSKEKRAALQITEKTQSDLENIRDTLKTAYKENKSNAKVAERYILSNILSNKMMPNSPQHTLVGELKTIIHSFLGTDKRNRSPEFYLLTLMLFWPEEEVQVGQEVCNEEFHKQEEDNNVLAAQTREDLDNTEDDTEAAQSSSGVMQVGVNPDLQECATSMEAAFENAMYAKYLRGRYLLPLFFLGKGSGLSKWIHRSRLDEIVEESVDLELHVEAHNENGNKMKKINEMWISGKVWELPKIKSILQPVQTKRIEEKEEVFVCVGKNKIKVRTESKPDCCPLKPIFYLGVNIKGLVVFKADAPRQD